MSWKKYMADKYYKACKYKGVFANCSPDVCLSCHRDSMKEIAQKMNKLWYIRIWKWCIRRKRFSNSGSGVSGNGLLKKGQHHVFTKERKLG